MRGQPRLARGSRAVCIAQAAAALLVVGCMAPQVDTYDVFAFRETAPVGSSGDAADDCAIWVHPTSAADSLIIATDKQAALLVYGLQGNLLQTIDSVVPNNVDLRYGFQLDGEDCDIVVFSDQATNGIGVYKIDPATRQLSDVADGALPTGLTVYGMCLYRSEADGKYYVFVTERGGAIRQWQLTDQGNGKIGASLARTLQLGSTCEGCVADDELGYLYVAEEDVGIWKYGAEPSAGSTRSAVDRIRSNADLKADLEGLALYRMANEGGYLIASVQGYNSYALYSRQDASYLGSFRIVDGGNVDGTNDTDGIEVNNMALGADFPSGLFVAQDYSNTAPSARQNFKLVPWEWIAAAFQPPLGIDSAHDVRP
jgi:3-phytase